MGNLVFYKPTPSNTGTAASFEIKEGKEDGSLSLNIQMIRQASWNAEKKRGSFSENSKRDANGALLYPEKNIGVKLSSVEAGGIIYAIENNLSWEAYHTFDGRATTLKFSPYLGSQEKQAPQGSFSLSIFKDKNVFRIGLTPGEAVEVREFLKYFLSEKYRKPFSKKAYLTTEEKMEQYLESYGKEENDSIPQ